MTHIITIETQSESDLVQLKGLIERLGLRYKEDHTQPQNEGESLRVLENVHWEGDETGDELNAMMQGARHFGSRDVAL